MHPCLKENSIKVYSKLKPGNYVVRNPVHSCLFLTETKNRKHPRLKENHLPK